VEVETRKVNEDARVRRERREARRLAAEEAVRVAASAAAAPRFTRIQPGVMSPAFRSPTSFSNNHRAQALVNAQQIAVPHPWDRHMRNMAKQDDKQPQQQQLERTSAKMGKSITFSASDGALLSRTGGSPGLRAVSPNRSRGGSPLRGNTAVPIRRPKHKHDFDTSSPYTGSLRPGHLLQPLPAPPSFGISHHHATISLARQEHGGAVGPALTSNVALARSYATGTTTGDVAATTTAAAPGAGGDLAGPAWMFDTTELTAAALRAAAAEAARVQQEEEEAKQASMSGLHFGDLEAASAGSGSMWNEIPTDRDRVAARRQAETAARAMAEARQEHTHSTSAAVAAEFMVRQQGGRSPERKSPSKKTKQPAHGSNADDHSPLRHLSAVHAGTLDYIVSAARSAAEAQAVEARRKGEERARERERHKKIVAAVAAQRLRSAKNPNQSRATDGPRQRESMGFDLSASGTFNANAFANSRPGSGNSPFAASLSRHNSRPGSRERSRPGSAARLSRSPSPAPSPDRSAVSGTMPRQRPDSSSSAAASASQSAAMRQNRADSLAALNQRDVDDHPPASTSPPQEEEHKDQMSFPSGEFLSPASARRSSGPNASGATGSESSRSEVGEHGRIRSRRGSIEENPSGAPLSAAQLIQTDEDGNGADTNKERRRSFRIGGAVAVHMVPADSATSVAASDGDPNATADLYHLDTPRGGRRLSAVSPPSAVRALAQNDGMNPLASPPRGNVNKKLWSSDGRARDGGGSGMRSRSGSRKRDGSPSKPAADALAGEVIPEDEAVGASTVAGRSRTRSAAARAAARRLRPLSSTSGGGSSVSPVRTPLDPNRFMRVRKRSGGGGGGSSSGTRRSGSTTMLPGLVSPSATPSAILSSILPSLADPSAGGGEAPSMAEYLATLAALEAVPAPLRSKALENALVPLPKEYKLVPGKGLLTHGSAAVYGATLTPELLAVQRRKKMRRERDQRRAEVAWEHRHAAHMARRETWQQDAEAEAQATRERLKADNEARLRALSAERRQRAAQRAQEKAELAERLRPQVVLANLLLTPGSTLAAQLDPLYSERAAMQREVTEWFQSLFNYAQKWWGLAVDPLLELLTLLNRPAADGSSAAVAELLGPFQSATLSRLKESPSLLRSQLLVRFHERAGSGPTTIAEALAGRPVSPSKQPAQKALSAEEAARVEELMSSVRAALDKARSNEAAEVATAQQQSEALAAKKAALAARLAAKQQALAHLRPGALSPSQRSLDAHVALLDGDGEAAVMSAEQQEAAAASRAAERRAKSAKRTDARHRRALTIQADAAAYKESPTASGAAPSDAALTVTTTPNAAVGSTAGHTPALSSVTASASRSRKKPSAQQHHSLAASPVVASVAGSPLSPPTSSSKPSSAASRTGTNGGGGASASTSSASNEAVEAQRAALEKQRAERRAAAAAEAEKKAEQALARKAEKERRAAEARNASKDAREARQLEKDAIAAAAAHARAQKETKQAAAAAAAPSSPSTTKSTKKPAASVGVKSARADAADPAAGSGSPRPDSASVTDSSAATRPRRPSASVTRTFDATSPLGSPNAVVTNNTAANAPSTDSKAVTAAQHSSGSGGAPRPAAVLTTPTPAAVSVTYAPETPLSPPTRRNRPQGLRQTPPPTGAGAADMNLRGSPDGGSVQPLSPARRAGVGGAQTGLERARVTRLLHTNSASDSSPGQTVAILQQNASPGGGLLASGRRIPRTPGSSALAGALSTSIALGATAGATTGDARGSPMAYPLMSSIPSPVPSPAHGDSGAAASSSPYAPLSNDDADLAALNAQVLALLEVENFATALPLALEELDRREERYGSTIDPRLLPALDIVASVHEVLEQPKQALPFLFQALQIERQRASGGSDGDGATRVDLIARSVPVSDALLRLGEALVALREGEDAFNTFARCYLIRRAALGPSHPATIQARQCVAFLTEPDFAIDELELAEIPLLQGETDPPEPVALAMPAPQPQRANVAAPTTASAVGAGAALPPKPASAGGAATAAAAAATSTGSSSLAAARPGSSTPKAIVARVSSVEEELILDAPTVQAIESRR
jgi:hypothetical protein